MASRDSENEKYSKHLVCFLQTTLSVSSSERNVVSLDEALQAASFSPCVGEEPSYQVPAHPAAHPIRSRAIQSFDAPPPAEMIISMQCSLTYAPISPLSCPEARPNAKGPNAASCYAGARQQRHLSAHGPAAATHQTGTHSSGEFASRSGNVKETRLP